MSVWVGYGLLIALLAPMVWFDVSKRQVSISYCVLLTAIGLATRLGAGIGNFETGFLSGVFAIAGTLGTFGLVALSKKGMGPSEVAMLCGVGAILGTPLHFTALIFVAIVGSAQGFLSVLWKRFVKKEKSTTLQTIPYGVSIALGSVWAIWWNADAT
jgi:prepilin peptidase CpaA